MQAYSMPCFKYVVITFFNVNSANDLPYTPNVVSPFEPNIHVKITHLINKL